MGLVELKNHLRQLGYIQDESDKINYGIVYENTGIFIIDQDTKNASLTSVGKELAALFNEDHSEFTPLEMLILRGLQQQVAGYAYLNIVGQNPGISREELKSRLVELYGGKGRYYTGYYIRLFSQIGLIAKKREGRQMTYYLTVPESWTGEAPQIEEDEE